MAAQEPGMAPTRPQAFALSLLAGAAVCCAQEGPTAPTAQPPAAAGAPSAGRPPEGAARGVHFSLSMRGQLGLNADLEHDEGDLTVTRLGANLTAIVPVGERSRLDVGLDEEFSHYDFNDATGFISGISDPFDDVQRTFLTARFGSQASERLGWFAGGLAGAAREQGADLGKSIEWGGFAGVRYALSERLTIGGGVGVFTRLEDNPLVIPVFSLDWEFAEGWRLSSGARPGLTLSYAPSDAWTFLIGGQYQFRDFRLDEDGPQPDGVVQDQSVDLNVGLEYHPNRQIEVDAGVSWSFGRALTLLDSGGNEVADVDVGGAPFLSAEVAFRF
jgi:hypothetical protein